jgi:hypothetical protein
MDEKKSSVDNIDQTKIGKVAIENAVGHLALFSDAERRICIPTQSVGTSCLLSPSSFPLFPQRRLGRGQAGDGHAERAAAYVVEADFVAELDGVGVAAVLSADADLQVLSLAPSLFDSHPH